ncbi:MAG TPA: peptidoglycan recognition family protein [Clostridia bacterium]|nr:peptidoglycan recognition family protein [Clostridia bacterium]
MNKFHTERGFSIVCFGHVYHVAYHYLILPDGKVETGRPDRCAGAHARRYNSYLGISLIGDFSSKDNPHGERGAQAPTPQQMRALAVVCRRLMTLDHVIRHSDVSNTQCPGDRFPFDAFVRGLK